MQFKNTAGNVHEFFFNSELLTLYFNMLAVQNHIRNFIGIDEL